MQNERQIDGKWAIQILEAPAASGIPLDLPFVFCNSRHLSGASQMQWVPSCSKVLNSSAIFSLFKRVRIEAVNDLGATLKVIIDMNQL